MATADKAGSVNRVLNLPDECGGLLTGREIARGQHNLTLRIETTLLFGKGRTWGVTVEKPRWSEAGRMLKPRRVLCLVANEGDTPADLLRQLANAWEQGDVEITEAVDG